jgi:hypothetical protein
MPWLKLFPVGCCLLVIFHLYSVNVAALSAASWTASALVHLMCSAKALVLPGGFISLVCTVGNVDNLHGGWAFGCVYNIRCSCMTVCDELPRVSALNDILRLLILSAWLFEVSIYS